MILIKEIKIAAKGRMEILYAEVSEDGNGLETERWIGDYSRPHPAFYDALRALVPHALSLVDLPADYAVNLAVTSLKTAWPDTGGVDVVFGCRKFIGGLDDFKFTCPSSTYKEEEGKENPAYRAILAVCVEAVSYVNGEREQMEMFRDAA